MLRPNLEVKIKDTCSEWNRKGFQRSDETTLVNVDRDD